MLTKQSNGVMTTRNFRFLIWFAITIGMIIAAYYVSQGQLKDSVQLVKDDVKAVESKQKTQEVKQKYIVEEMDELKTEFKELTKEFKEFKEETRSNNSDIGRKLDLLIYKIDNQDTGG